MLMCEQDWFYVHKGFKDYNTVAWKMWFVQTVKPVYNDQGYI